MIKCPSAIHVEQVKILFIFFIIKINIKKDVNGS